MGAELPRTAPTGPDDPRIAHYADNVYQVSQGGRYYLWYGCGQCHQSGRQGPDLASGQWRRGDSFDAIYASIAHGHPGGTAASYGQRIPSELLWEMTAYVRSLPTLDARKRRRLDMDTFAEPDDRHGPGAR